MARPPIAPALPLAVPLALSLVLAGSSCQRPPPPPPERMNPRMEFALRVMQMVLDDARGAAPATQPATRPATQPAGPVGGVTHVVLVWLKRPGDPQARGALLASADAIRSIPGVVDVRAGRPLPSTRPAVDATYDVAFVITFTDEKALRDYATHPTHQRLLDEVMRPHADRYKVYDFTTGG